MNSLTKPATSTHPVDRQKRAEQKELQKRNKKAKEYLGEVVPKLKKYSNK